MDPTRMECRLPVKALVFGAGWRKQGEVLQWTTLPLVHEVLLCQPVPQRMTL